MDDEIVSKAFVRIKNADVSFAGYELPDGDHKLYTAVDLEQARREEREACAALVKAIRDNLGEISMRASIVYDACTVIEKAILTRNEK